MPVQTNINDDVTRLDFAKEEVDQILADALCAYFIKLHGNPSRAIRADVAPDGCATIMVYELARPTIEGR